MNQKSIKKFDIAFDQYGNPTAAYVIYDDGSYEPKLLTDPKEIRKVTVQVSKQNPDAAQLRAIATKHNSIEELERAYQADFAKSDHGITPDSNVRGEKVTDKNYSGKTLAAVGATAAVLGAAGGAVGTAAMHAMNNQPDKADAKIVATAETAAEADEDESQLTSNVEGENEPQVTSDVQEVSAQTTQEISNDLQSELKLTAFQEDFLETAETTISQYNDLCDKYDLSDDYKINIKEYLAAYISYNDLSDKEAKELIPILLETTAEDGNFIEVGQRIDTNTLNSWLQSLHAKWMGMSAVITDVEDVSVFDGFIQKVGMDTKTEQEANRMLEASQNSASTQKIVYTEENKAKDLSNLYHTREIYRQMWTYFAEANSNQQSLGKEYFAYVTDLVRESDGTVQQSATNSLIADTYGLSGYKIEGNPDATIVEYTHEYSSYMRSTQDDQHNQSYSDVIMSVDSKVEGPVATRFANAIKLADEAYNSIYSLIEEEGVVKYRDYVHSEYNEKFNEMLKKYEFELWNEEDTASKNKSLQELIREHSYRYNSMLDPANNGQYVGSTRTVTSTPEVYTETVPGEGDLILSDEEEQRAAIPGTEYNPEEIDQVADDLVDDGFTYHDNNNNGVVDGGDSLTDTGRDPKPPKIETPFDGAGTIVKGDGSTEQIYDDSHKSDSTNNPETEHVKDVMKENGYNADNRLPDDQTTSQPEAEAPAQDTPVVDEIPSTPEVEEPVIDETPSTPEVEKPVIDETPSAPDSGTTDDNNDVTHDANTDGTSVDVEVGDVVPLTLGEEDAAENSEVFDSEGNYIDGIVMASPAPEMEMTVETEQATIAETPVVETPAPEPAPVVETPVVETPAPEPAPAVETPVVETPAPEPAPAVETPVVEAPAPEPAPAVETPVVEAPVPEPAPAVETPVVEAPVPEPAPVVTEPVVEAPEPVAETTSSSVTVEVDGDLATFDGAGNLTNVEPAPVAEEATENVKTM